MSEAPLFLTVASAARYVGVSRWTFSRIARRDAALARCRRAVGGSLRWHRPSLDRWAEKLPQSAAGVRIPQMGARA